MLGWLHRRGDDSRLVEVDAVTLIVLYGLAAHSEARKRQQDTNDADMFAHWGRVAHEVAERTGGRIALVTETRAFSAPRSATVLPPYSSPILR